MVQLSEVPKLESQVQNSEDNSQSSSNTPTINLQDSCQLPSQDLNSSDSQNPSDPTFEALNSEKLELAIRERCANSPMHLCVSKYLITKNFDKAKV